MVSLFAHTHTHMYHVHNDNVQTHRTFDDVELHPSPQLNVIVGPNGMVVFSLVPRHRGGEERAPGIHCLRMCVIIGRSTW